MIKKAFVLDYGTGNLGALVKFLFEFEYDVSIGNDFKNIMGADLLVMPGVGAFGPALRRIVEFDSFGAIHQRHTMNKPILGICLGFQLLTKSSEESVGSLGINIFEADTVKILNNSRIGWSELYSEDELFPFNGQSFYFNHSYAAYDLDPLSVVARADSSSYVAIAKTNSTVGVQFHPEKSQIIGYDFMNWLNSNWRNE